jgi:hypothetical protein
MATQRQVMRCLNEGDNERRRIMKKLLVPTVAATMLMVAAPAFAGPADDAEQGYSTYPSVDSCHFVLQRTMTQDGRVILQRQQVCD